MYIFCIAAFNIFSRFENDDFGMSLLSRRRRKLFCRCCVIYLVAAFVVVIAFVDADAVVGVFWLFFFYVVCVVVDMAVVLSDVSGYPSEAVDVLFDVVGIFVLFDVFGALAVGGGGVFVDGASAPIDTIDLLVDSYHYYCLSYS